MSGTLALALQFWVEQADGTQALAADLQLDGIDFQFTALINNMDIALSISKINISTVTVVSSTIGRLSAVTIKLELNNAFRIGIPLINAVLTHYQIKFPSNIFGIFELSDLVLGYHDNFIYAGATPTFIGPSAKKAAQEVTGVKEAIEAFVQ